jgi:hypothetical protein
LKTILRETRPRGRSGSLCGFAAAIACLALAATASAQYEIKGKVANKLSYRAGGIPSGSGNPPSGEPTITPQFSNVVETNAASGAITNSASLSSRHPSSPTVILRRSSLGHTFSSGVPRYFLGDQIIPPTSYPAAGGTVVATTADFWRAEPVRPGEIIVNPNNAPLKDSSGAAIANDAGVIVPKLATGTYENFYYSPHAKQVFANQPGQVKVWWRSRLPNASNEYVLFEETFSVSSSTTRPVRPLFWTEKSFNGPPVNIPSGRIVTVNPVYSNVFPSSVTEEFEAVGSSPPSDPEAQPASELRTVWFEKTNGIGSLRAYNISGRVLVEYLGELKDDGSHEFLGADVVEVSKAAAFSTITVELGSEIRPAADEPLLEALPVATDTSGSTSFYASTPRPDGSLAYYAEAENALEDRVVFYWMETLDAAVPPPSGKAPGLEIDWPKYLHKYLQVWPSDVSHFAHYTIPSGGSTLASGTGLRFEGGAIPTLVYQDDPSEAEAVLDSTSQRLLVSPGGDSANRALLKFTGTNGAVWYVPLLTQTEGMDGYVESDGMPVLNGQAWVGERIERPSADYSLAGYIAEGDCHSPNAYINPFDTGIAEAEKGAIIPVNALPGDSNALKIWWFKRVKAPSDEFSDFYTPAKIGTYAVKYRTSTTVAGESFDSGATGWSNTLTTTGPSGRFLGNFGSLAGVDTEKTFTVEGSGAGAVTISFTFHRLDSWDANENFEVYLNGNRLINQPFTYASEVTTPIEQSGYFENRRFSWSITPVAGGFGNYFGGVWNDQSFRVRIQAEFIDGQTAHSVKLGFNSTLNSPSSDESYAIDDIKIETPLPRQIILASNEGTGALSSAMAAGRIYNQPDPKQAGYNPNEEHALMLGGQGYALRDDLNLVSSSATAVTGTDFTSLPRVLIEHTDPDDKRPAIAVYEVLREDSFHKFSYGITAGTILNSPMPLPLLPLPVDPVTGLSRNLEVASPYNSPESVAAGTPSYYGKFTFKDRKGYDWVYRGPHDGGTPSLGMQFYYPMQKSFVFPNRTQPAEGTPLPFLRPVSNGSFTGDPVTGTPITVAYFPAWPTNPPTLAIGETLTLPKRGLPAVRGQHSAQVLYQQSIARSGNTKPSAVLHDPTRAKSVLLNSGSVGLTALPVSVATTMNKGKTYFQLLPPHLQQRCYFDPNLGDIGGLVLIGEFVDETAGEDYLHLNALSPEDVVALKNLADPEDPDASKWHKAIDHLTTVVETFVEDPAKKGTYIADSSQSVTVGNADLALVNHPDTAVDSYALTANGEGAGYVTLVFGNGVAFTPKGDPVSMTVIKVDPQLYTGDLKNLVASNPLDEQTTLRHSGDFAARPGNYEFEWRYAAPVDGVAPVTYVKQMTTVVDNTAQWQLKANPSSPLPVAAEYPATLYNLPRSITVNDSSYVPGSGLPGQVARGAKPVKYSAGSEGEAIFSADLNPLDGFVLYINGTPVLASRLPAGTPVPGGLSQTEGLSGLSSKGLTYQYRLPSSAFINGDNQLEVALYSAATPGTNPTLQTNLRLELTSSVDRVDPDVYPSSPWLKPAGSLSNIAVVGGSADSPLGNPLLLFSDNYFTLRYRPLPGKGSVAGEGWSKWMEPKLVQSWIKRALDGINPFNQRNNDLFNNPVSTDVSMLTQAGTRWEGDVALNIDNINDFGLIEIYETLLNRAKKLSIDAGYDDPGTNDTLLLTAGYLSDLYVLLGNEAADDADNPTIAIDGSTESGEVETSRFSFEGQIPTLIEEELALLSGRDDFLSPSVTTAPAYNRLYWNYTNGIASGESIYAINYNIKEKAGATTANGTIDADDAQHMFPQGHGDAYGHYLTALTGYYKLLTSDSFTWVPRSEGVDVLGQTVQVDYQDERKFAAAAAAVARTSARILDITGRITHRDDPADGWEHMRDNKRNDSTGIHRQRGADEWASRGGQGAYLHWISANAMLPDVDTNPAHTGIRVIDRKTVPELNELVSSARRIQESLDSQCAHLNPLGLAKGAIAFDISPTELKAGASHFDQVYARALRANLNAKAAFDQASAMNRQLRQQNNSLDDYNEAVDKQERAYEYELVTLFGSAYPGDSGPGRLYEQGYEGPDLYHYWMIDRPSVVTGTDTTVTASFREPLEMNPFVEWSLDNAYGKINDPVQYVTRELQIVPHQLMQFAPSGHGSRRQPGALQSALLDVYQAQVGAREAANKLDSLSARFERDYQLFTEFRTDYEDAVAADEALVEQAETYLKAAEVYDAASQLLELVAEYSEKIGDVTSMSFPTVVGFSMDTTSVLRSLTRYGGMAAGYAQEQAALQLETVVSRLEGEAQALIDQTGGWEDELARNYEDKQHVVEFERLLLEVIAQGYELSRRAAELQRANEAVASLMARGDHILADREIFRQRAAAVVQGYRTRDMTYRTFRNEELSQYQALYDLAAQYTYLAVQSYDYETGLLGTPAGQELINDIVGTRSLGKFQNGMPVASTGTTGDGGLASILARLTSDWSVVKPRLGINNPDQYGTVFSLRQELFRIRTDAATSDDDKLWQQTIQQHIMSNVLNDPDVSLNCRNIAKTDGSSVPGIVIPFSSTIAHGLNFFGQTLAAGDHAYTASNFSTKIHSTGVVLKGYVGMDPYAFGSGSTGAPASSSPDALSASPYVYLIPAGEDSMIAPPLGDSPIMRYWSVKDQAMPLPFNLGQNDFSATQFFTPQGTVNEQLWITRKHQAFRAVSDAGFFYSTLPAEFTNSRLVGRSVCNSRWKLVIPAYTLLNKEQDGLDRFTRTVQDIQVFFRSYSHSGN